MQSRGERAPEAGLPRVAIDRFEIILPFAVEARPDPAHLVGAGGVDRLRCLLLRVYAEGAEEIRQADYPAAGLLEPREQIPIQRELVARVDAAGDVPGALAPEERLLRRLHP